MSALNLQTHGRALKAAHQAVLDSQQQCAWAVFGYDRGTPDLKVVSQSTDSGSDNADDILAEFQDEFSDSKCLFGFVKAQDPNSRLPKIAFVSWCGQGVPVSNKGMFFGHVNDASRFLRGFHVQIDARHDDDVSPDAILRKLRESSGSQYSIHSQPSKPAPAVPSSKPAFTAKPAPVVPAKTAAPPPAKPAFKPRWTPPTAPSSSTVPPAPSVRPVSPASPSKPSFSSTPVTASSSSSSYSASSTSNVGSSGVATASLGTVSSMRGSYIPPSSTSFVPKQSDTALNKPKESKWKIGSYVPVNTVPAWKQREEEDKKRRQQDEEVRRQREEEFKRERATEQEREREQEREQQAAVQQAREERERAEAAQRERDEAERIRRQREEERRESERREREQQERFDRERREREEKERIERDQRAERERRERAEREEQEQRRIRQQQEDKRRAEEEASAAAAAAAAAARKAAEIERQERETRAALDAAKNDLILKKEPTVDTVTAGTNNLKLDKDDEKSELTAVAEYDYAAEDDTELSFNEGDVIVEIVKVDDDWWHGKSQDGSRAGLFPANYVSEVKQPPKPAASVVPAAPPPPPMAAIPMAPPPPPMSAAPAPSSPIRCAIPMAPPPPPMGASAPIPNAPPPPPMASIPVAPPPPPMAAVPAAPPPPPMAAVPAAPPPPPMAAAPAAGELVAIAMYDYDAEDDSEITFREDDIITDIKKLSDDWWSGRNPDGKEGLFPAAYVQLG